MLNRRALKIGNKVIVKFGDFGPKTIRFETEPEAFDFVNYVGQLNPNSEQDYESFLWFIENYKIKDDSKDFERIREAAEIKESLEVIVKLDSRFKIVDGSLTFSETKELPIPKVIALELAKQLKASDDIEPLINFWRLNALNPNPEAREGLYRFITDLNLSLTNDGLFVAYRNVISLNHFDEDLFKRVNKIWKKSIKDPAYAQRNQVVFSLDISYMEEFEPELNTYDDDDYKDYEEVDEGLNITKVLIFSDEEFDRNLIGEQFFKLPQNVRRQIVKHFVREDLTTTDIRDVRVVSHTVLGSLQEVYLDIAKQAAKDLKLTDNHTRTMDIRIGEVSEMPREKCDSNPHSSCSRGLHVGSERFLNKNSFGNLGLVVLVNPKDVVAVPYEYGNSYKLRCCKYLPIAFAEYDKDGKLVPIKNKTININAGKYLMDEINLIQEVLKTDFEYSVEHKLLPEELTYESIEVLLSKIENSIKQRTIQI